MLSNKRSLLTLLTIFFSYCTFSQSFVNGDLEGTVSWNAAPPGWTQIPLGYANLQTTNPFSATSDVHGVTGPNIGNGNFGNPQSGNTFVSGFRCDAGGTSIFDEGVFQTVSGFTVGQQYQIDLWQAVVQQNSWGLDQSGSWGVYLDNNLIGITAPTTTTLNYDDINLEWEQRTLTFTACNTTHSIYFLPRDDDNDLSSTNGEGVRMGLDNVSLTPLTVPPTVTITPVASICVSQVPFNLSGSPMGGTWSGTGITDANAGTFDPAAAGIGTHTITYDVPCLGTETIDITVTNSDDPSWTVPTGLCASNAPVDLSTLITGTPGGTFSGTGITGTMFDPSVGSQTITYTVGAAPCDATLSQQITVVAAADANWTVPAGLCASNAPVDLSTFITGTPGGTFSGTGITGTMFDPSVGSQTITYTVGTAPCDATLSQQITIVSTADATWTAPTGLCGGNAPVDLSALITGTPGGTFSGTGITGTMFDPSVGTQTITYTVGTAPCDDALALQINIVPSADASWTAPTGLCITGTPIDLTTVITGNTGGTFSGTGITGNFFDPTVGTQMITYTVGTAPCDATVTQQIVVDLPLSAGLDSTITICGANPNILNLSTLLNGADLGGAWQETSVTPTGQFSTAQGQLTLTGLTEGLYTFTYTQNINSNCAPDVATITINYGVTGNAGMDGQVVICQDNGLVDLFSLITGNPDAGGQWSPPTAAGNGIFDPSVDNGGTYSYTVYSSPFCVQDTSKATIDIINAANIQIVGPAELCLGNGAQAYTSNVPNGTWSGQGISNQGIFNPVGINSGSTTITYTFDSLGCQSSSDFTIALNDAPTVEIFYDGELCDDDEQFISPIVTNATNYFWSDGHTDLNRIIQGDYSLIDQTIQLTLTADNFCGTASETVTINVNQCGETVYVPNAFTPDGDEFNQTFKPVLTGIDIHNYQMVIFNRWGEVLFETNNPEVGWDGTYGGTSVQDGTYTWSLQYKLPNEDGNTRLVGHVNLIR